MININLLIKIIYYKPKIIISKKIIIKKIKIKKIIFFYFLAKFYQHYFKRFRNRLEKQQQFRTIKILIYFWGLFLSDNTIVVKKSLFLQYLYQFYTSVINKYVYTYKCYTQIY